MKNYKFLPALMLIIVTTAFASEDSEHYVEVFNKRYDSMTTPEMIEIGRKHALKTMVYYCHSQISSLQDSLAFYEAQRKALSNNEKIDAYDRSSAFKQISEMLGEDVDNFVHRCGWMLD